MKKILASFLFVSLSSCGAGVLSCDVSDVTVKTLLANPKGCLGERVAIQGFTPGIPSLFFDSKDIYSRKEMKEGVFIDLFEVGGLTDCIVGDIQVVSTVSIRGERVRLSAIERIQNVEAGEICFEENRN